MSDDKPIRRDDLKGIDGNKINPLQPVICSTCGGKGAIRSMFWMDFFRGHPEPGDRTMEIAKAWFKKRGFAEMPPKYLVCPDCDGRGHVLKKSSMKEFIKGLKKIYKKEGDAQ